MAQWIGYMVSIKCADSIGTYQGEISTATNTSITLTKAFCNGFPCPEKEVKIRACDILDLKLIDKQSSTSAKVQSSTITIAKPIAKRAAGGNNRTQTTSESTSITNAATGNSSIHSKSLIITKSKPIDIEQKFINNHHNLSESASSFKSTPNKREKNKGKWSKGWKDEECFGSPLDEKINKDFDFEKNLALFNKQAVWDELNAHKPDVIKHVDNKKQAKYKHNENVLATVPTTYRQITVPKQDICEYVTDDGLIIPSIPRSLRKKLWDAADRVGLTWDKRIELMGRAAAEISIQLLGGGHRLNPRNTHQLPTVIVLCGPHEKGALGVNTARQLASQGIRTIVYTVSVDAPQIKKELSLYMLTKNRLITDVSDLPSIGDLIIVALCQEEHEIAKQHAQLSSWVNRSRASVLALDPPAIGTPGITPKFSLVPVLPLPHAMENGKLYLCNLGFPVELFNQVGIKYKSPFGSKFVIPLHPRDD